MVMVKFSSSREREIQRAKERERAEVGKRTGGSRKASRGRSERQRDSVRGVKGSGVENFHKKTWFLWILFLVSLKLQPFDFVARLQNATNPWNTFVQKYS